MLAEIDETLEALLTERQKRGDWLDDSGQTGLLQTCEALECFLIPAVQLRGTAFGARVRRIPAEILGPDIEKVCGRVERVGWAPEPYVSFGGVGYQKGVSDLTDVASFVLSMLSDALVCHRLSDPALPPGLVQRCHTVIEEAVSWLMSNASTIETKVGRVVQWSAGPKGGKGPRIPGVYFTYSAVAGLQSWLDAKLESRIRRENVIELIVSAWRWLESCIKPSAQLEGILELSFAQRALSERVDDRALLTYLLPTAEGAFPYLGEAQQGVTERLVEIVRSLMRCYDDVDEKYIFDARDTAHLIPTYVKADGKSEDFPDRTILYVLLEGLCWLKGMVLSRVRADRPGQESAEEFGVVVERMIWKLVAEILDRRDPERKLWNKGKGRFYIYYNQRAIEALAYCLRYVGEMAADEEIVRVSRRDLEEAIGRVFSELSGGFVEQLTKRIRAVGRPVKLPYGVGVSLPDVVDGIQKAGDNPGAM